MKHLLTILVLFALTLTGCTSGEGESKLPELVVEAYVCDETVHEEVNASSEFAFETLEVGVPRIMRISAGGTVNLAFRFGFEGNAVVVESPSFDVQLSVSDGGELWSVGGTNLLRRNFGFDARVSDGSYLAANPLGSHAGHQVSNNHPNYPVPEPKGYLGREYVLELRGILVSDETPVVNGYLRLTQLTENEYGGSSLYSVELTALEYGSRYES